jgi:uncharacterized ferritin-like protein (DUF455 family)
MDLNQFAATILFEPALAAKLLDAPSFTDAPHPALAAPPVAPARPPALALRPRGETPRTPFPSLAELEKPPARGIVLHFFANHELLAMELMALAILRFPDAPASFRLGVAQTIREEQTHLRLYLDRMAQLGVAFGDVPVNRFFWDCIAGMRSPMDYVTQMSLTLEQANLDYSRHYRDVFAALGDAETAAILERVYREEIGHVKHGVVWFDRWRDQSRSQWDDYVTRMQPPLAASRAKGIGYDRDGRRAAGLTPAFIDELAVYKHSKGRPPTVYFFNPACEEEILHATPAFNPNKGVAEIARDLAPLMLFTAADGDVVLCTDKPGTAFLAKLQQAGFNVPQLATDSDGALKGRPVNRIEPWGQSPAAARRAAGLGAAILSARPPCADYAVFRKDWSARLAARLGCGLAGSRVVAGGDALAASCAEHFAASTAPLVAKAPLGASGRNMQRILAPGPVATQRSWLTKTLDLQGSLVLEPWLDKVVDLSVQLNVGTGEKPVLGITRFYTDTRGQYIGHRLGRKLDDLPVEWLRVIYGERMQETLLDVGAQVVEALAAAGYSGPAGVDSFIYRDGETLKLRPIVEINPRHTMGRIAWSIDRRVHHAVEALWLHLTRKQIEATGAADFSAFAAAWESRYPLETKHRLIVGGALATTDPAQARTVLTLLLVGEKAVREGAALFLDDRLR